MLLGATVAISLIACGSSEVSNNEEELKQQIEELQQQLAEAQQGAKEEVDENKNDSASDESSLDSETQSLIDSINADTAEYQGVCGADAKWYYKDNVLVIKGTGEITDNPWQSVEYRVNGKTYSDRIFKINWVIIDEGITSIYDGSYDSSNAFEYIRELTKVVLPTSLEKIGAYSFMKCDNLSNINIPSNVTEIGEGAFYCCSSITDIIIPDGVKKIEESTFYRCTNLVNVNLPDSLTVIDSIAFYECPNLSGIMIPDSITELRDKAFYNCTSLDEATIKKIQSINQSAYEVYEEPSTESFSDTEQ